MALGSTTGQNPNAGAATAEQPDPSTMSGATRVEAPRPEEGASYSGRGNIRDLLAKSPIPIAMSEGASKYIENMKKFFAGHQNVAYRNIQVIALQDPNGVFMVEYGDRVAPIIMHEMVSAVIADNAPDSVVMQAAAINYKKYIRTDGRDFTLLPAVAIHPSDYHKVDVMATILCQTLANVAGSEEITAGVLRNEPMIISIAQNEVMSFVERLSPHGIPARHDIGFKLSLAPAGMNYQSRQELFSAYKNDIQDLAAVTAYVEIITGPIDPLTGVPKYTPVVHITDIVSRIQDIRMYLILVSMAAEIFIRQHLWKHQFTRFNKDEPNLGYLITDPNTKDLMFLGSPAEVESFIHTYMTAPVLVVDMADGRSRIPETELMVLTSSNQGNERKLQTLAVKFQELCASMNVTGMNQVPFMPYSFENIGLATVGGNLMDTREIDYLRLATTWRSDIATAAHLLNRPVGVKPSERFDLQRRFYTDAVALYNNNILQVNLNIIAALQAELSRNLLLDRTSWSPSMANIDMSGAISQSLQYLTGPGGFGVNGGGFGTMSTMGIYGGMGR